MATAAVPFTTGALYGQDAPIHFGLSGSGIWNDEGARVARVFSDGAVLVEGTDQLVGFANEGTVIDLSGDTLAVVELSPSRACPDDFLGSVRE
ncbi:MAG: hypothetical protein ACRDWD_12775 [Acidimicrobiia bacterium]